MCFLSLISLQYKSEENTYWDNFISRKLTVELLYHHIGNAKNPCIKATIGDTTTVAGTDITEEEAMVWAITARAVTGHNRETGHLLFMTVTETVAAIADTTDMVGLVVIKMMETRQRMELVTRRIIPTAESVIV